MFEVEWLPSVERDLADLWIVAPDRAHVAAAADAIDAALRRDPFSIGEGRGGTTRIAFERPLAVLYDVHVPLQRVKVWDLWRWPS